MARVNFVDNFLRRYPFLKDWRFWLAQGAVFGLAYWHTFLEENTVQNFYQFYFIPVGLSWVPIAYVAWILGFRAAMVTTVWSMLLMFPDVIFFQTGINRVFEISEVMSINLAAILIGYIVDQKKAALDRAKLYAGHSLRAQEEERRRLSRDLHDNVLQSLIAVIQKLDNIKYFSAPLAPSVSDQLVETRQIVEQAVYDLRSTAVGLRPPSLDDLGLRVSIQRLLTNIERRAGLSTELNVYGEERRLTEEQQTGLFRIAQEAIYNVERHAKATQLTVDLTYSADETTMEICDNGIGFIVPRSAQQLANLKTLGILGMTENSELLGGRMDIESHAGKGTRVFIRVLTSV